MTNEELCKAYQNGDTEALYPLWEQNKGVIALHMRKLYNRNRERAISMGVEVADLEQSAYFAVMNAAKGYHEECGNKFTTYLAYHLMSVFCEALGIRTKRGWMEPIAKAQRFEELVPGSEEITIGEIIPDESAALAFEEAQDRVYNEELHEALEEAMQAISAQEAAILRGRYYEGQTQSQLAEAIGVSRSRINQLEKTALRDMKNQHGRLREFANDFISNRAYGHSGFEAWKNGGSIQERIIEQLEKYLKEHNPQYLLT